MKTIGDIRYSCIPALENDVNDWYSFAGPVHVSYVTFSENVTYVVTNEEGEKIGIISLHRPGYHTVGELCDELLWMDEVRQETDVTVPAVYRDKTGHFLRPLVIPHMPRLYYSIFAFVPGKTLETMGDCSETVAKQIGRMAAQLHEQAKRRARKRQKLDCFTWDIPELLGKQARWGSFMAYPAQETQKRLLRQAADKICYHLEEYGRNERNYFLIHADLHAGNLLVQGDTVTLIDFDDCGYSWFLYDLGSFLSRQNEHLTEWIDNWCTGYEYVAPLRAQDIAMIPSFMVLRRLVRLGWLASHRGNDVADEKDTQYLDMTVTLADRYVHSGQI